jgi:hypothetical protein
VSNESRPAREPVLKRMFFGSPERAERDDKVLQYIIHRVKEDADLHNVLREDYVRRNLSESEIDRLINDFELVHAAREHLWQMFRSGELGGWRRDPDDDRR